MKRRILALLLAAVLLVGLAPTLAPRAAKAEPTPEYWIGVDVKNQRTTIYRVSDNSVVHRWLCTTGGPDKPTPVGTYHLPAAKGSERQEWFSFTKSYVKYAVRYTRRLYFHSVLFRTKDDNSMYVSTLKNLGKRGSAGCVRLEVAHAKWICDNCPTGTLVIIHNGVDDPRITSVLGANAGLETTPSLPAPPVVTGLTLDQTGTVTLKKGETLQLNCGIMPTSATTSLRWKSSKKKYVAVSESGLVTAKGNGTATITVTASNGVKTSVKVESVDPSIAKKVKLDKKGTVILALGDTLQLNATVDPAAAAEYCTWKSSKTTVAEVNADGLVTPVAEGKTKITVTAANRKRASVTVKVVNPNAPVSVHFAETGPIILHVGDTVTLTPKLEPTTATTTYKFTTSRKKVAKVDPSDGTVTAVKKGTARITVKTGNGKKARITIKVVP